MPEFSSGEVKTAIIPMSNPTDKVFDYSVEIYMGTTLTLMASTPFHLNAKESKDISLPITMPSTPGTYPIYIAVFSGGVPIPPLYQGVDVVITAIIEYLLFAIPVNVGVTIEPVKDPTHPLYGYYKAGEEVILTGTARYGGTIEWMINERGQWPGEVKGGVVGEVYWQSESSFFMSPGWYTRWITQVNPITWVMRADTWLSCREV